MPTTLKSRLLGAGIGAALSVAAVLAPSFVGAAQAPQPQLPSPAGTVEVRGQLANGTRYVLQRPPNWNGMLLLEADLPDGRRGTMMAALQAMGWATGGRSRDVTNWQIRNGSSDLVQLKALFADRFGKPKTTIVMGGSLGGLVSRDTGETYPQHFQAAIPTCGGGAGLIGMYNNRYDVAFALKTLLAPDDDAIEIANIKNDQRSGQAMRAAVDRALKTPEGRARLALIGAIGQLQGWPTGAPEPPADTDYDTRLKAIGDAAAMILLLKSDVEKAAGGVFSWNEGIDYRAMFEMAGPQSTGLARELYRQAGLNLDADLAKLQAAPRLKADPAALAWARTNGVASGKLQIPTLVLFTAVDPRAPLSEYRAYQTVVDRAGSGALLRQAGVKASGHCAFNPVELMAGVMVMQERLATGRWPATTPAALNARAAALTTRFGAPLGLARFTSFPATPAYPRTFASDDVIPSAALRQPAPGDRTNER